MGNEMGNSNISGLKEEENTAVEAAENSSQETSHVDDVKGENQIVPAGEGKDFHEKVEGLSSDDSSVDGDPHVDKQTSDENEQDDSELKPSLHSTDFPTESNDAASQDSGSQKVSSPKDMNHLEKQTESNVEENLLGASDHQIEKQTPTGREEVEASNSTCDTKSELATSEPLESAASQCNQHKQGEVHAEPLPEEHNRPPSCQAEEKEKLLETEATHNLVETVVSDAKIDEETSSQKDLVDTSISDDKREITAKDEVENGLSNMTSSFQSGLDNKCNEEVPTEMSLSRNGSSKSTEEAISQRNSSNTIEEVPQQEDKCVVITEDMKVIESLSENEESNHHADPTQFPEQVANELKADEVSASQPELVLDGSGSGNEKESIVDSSCNSAKAVKVAENGYQLDVCNENLKEKIKDSEELIEITPPAIETVLTELTVTEYSGEEEEEPTEKKVIEAIEEKAENLKQLGSDAEASETTEQPMPQSHEVDYANSLFPADSCPLLKLQNQNQDTVIGSETIESRAVSLTELKQDSCSEFLGTTASSVDSKQTLVSTVGLENVKAETNSMTVAETETLALFTSSGNEAEESARRLSTESIPENPSVHVDLRKSPSFDFDLSLGARSEESDQTPLLLRDKAATRSLSNRDGANFGNPTAETKYGLGVLKYQAISVEEKTIEVERSDLDKSRAPFLNFLKDHEKANAAVKAQKQDSHVGEKKTVESSCAAPSNEVALTKGSGKRKPRASLFSTCICCAAAAIN